MLIAIERIKFNYLYKYNFLRVDLNQIIDKTTDELKALLQDDHNSVVTLLNNSLPLFEQDHEIILLEIDKSKLIIANSITIPFNSIQCIYPLTKLGQQLIEGKINVDFIVKAPFLESTIEFLKINRSMAFRREASKMLLNIFNLSGILEKELEIAIETSIKKSLLDKTNPQEFKSYLDYLISYNKTPSFIPEGNIEFICKIGAIAIKYLGKPEEVFTNGPFYNSCLKHKTEINSTSYFTSYLSFKNIKDPELNSSVNKIEDYISKDFMRVNIFKASYFILAFKSFLNKNENNLLRLNNEIHEIINSDKINAAFVLSVLGYIFSFENLYESLHKLSRVPLLSNKSLEKVNFEGKKYEEKLLFKKNETKLRKLDIEQQKIKDEDFFKDEESENLQILNNITTTNEVTLNNKNKPPSKETSEPEMTYNKLSNTVEFHIDHSKVEKSTIKDNLYESNPSVSDQKKILTVQLFKEFILNELSKQKQKIWFELLETYFPSQNDELTLSIVLGNLETVPHAKDKLLKTKKDKELIKTFFDLNK